MRTRNAFLRLLREPHGNPPNGVPKTRASWSGGTQLGGRVVAGHSWFRVAYLLYVILDRMVVCVGMKLQSELINVKVYRNRVFQRNAYVAVGQVELDILRIGRDA